jgi:tetratricopeptide (TPR) repeat protein
LLLLSYPFHKQELFLPFFLLVSFPFAQITFPIYIRPTTTRAIYFFSCTIIVICLITYITLANDIIIWKINTNDKVFFKPQKELAILDKHIHIQNFTRSKLLGERFSARPIQIIKSIEELEQYATNTDLLLVKGNCYYDLQQYEKAIGCYQFACELVPYRILPKYYLARTYKEINVLSKSDSLKNIILHQKPKIFNASFKKVISLTKKL